MTCNIYACAQLPQEIVVATCAFPSVEAAAKATHEIMKSGVQIGCVELLDDVMMKYASGRIMIVVCTHMFFFWNRAINLNTGSTHAEQPTLFFKLTGSKGSVQEAQTYVVVVCLLLEANMLFNGCT